jgi:hypothetical protein
MRPFGSVRQRGHLYGASYWHNGRRHVAATRRPPTCFVRRQTPVVCSRAGGDYTVVMVTPVSIRFRRAEVADRLKAEAGARNVSTSALAEELIEEGLRLRRHPMIIFRDGASGRRAGLIGGPDVWEVVGGLLGGDVAPENRISRVAEHLGLSHQQIDAVLDYYADFTTEIDEEMADNVAAADELEAAWQRRQGLLAGSCYAGPVPSREQSSPRTPRTSTASCGPGWRQVSVTPEWSSRRPDASTVVVSLTRRTSSCR